MTEEEKKAIDIIKYNDIARPLACGDATICSIEDLNTILNLIQKQQAEIEKKDKTINKMAKELIKNNIHKRYCYRVAGSTECNHDCIDCIKQYF